MTRVQRALTAIERRRKLKLALRVGGVLVGGLGVLLLPGNIHVLTRSGVSAFKTIVDLGAFAWWGLACIAAGLLAAGASFLIRDDVRA